MAGLSLKIFRSGAVLAVVSAAALCAPDPALAIQAHGGLEGLYVHQLGHILFLAASIYLVARLKGATRGWRFIRWAFVLWAVWNVATFTGHILEEFMPVPPFSGGDGIFSHDLAKTSAPLAYAFYILKFDHLVSVPAMLLFLLGLRSLALEEK